jgi:hypothetical protein
MEDMINKNKSLPYEPQRKILPRRPRTKLEDIIKIGPEETV